MKIFSIFGSPVSHSRSPLMHNSVFKALDIKACYSRTHLDDGERLRDVFIAKKLHGANVTVPHKEAAFRACDEIRGVAQNIGAVNTIVLEDKKLIGYNTDGDGFLRAISRWSDIKSVLILGAGGTAKALATILSSAGYGITILNRSSGNLEHFTSRGFSTFTHSDFAPAKYDLLINTTSAGLADDNLPMPIRLLEKQLELCSYGVDVIYGKETPFLKLLKERNIPHLDGSDMLLEQGVLASYLFLEQKYPLQDIDRTMRESFKL